MRPAPLIGWQTLLADLSLILFMVTAAAMASTPDQRPGAAAGMSPPTFAMAGPAVRAEPLAVWRGGGAQTLRGWLAAQQPDPRQQLTITVSYAPRELAHALATAQALAAAAGQPARLVLEPARDEAAQAALAYDEAPTRNLARGLLDNRGARPIRNPR